MPQLTVVGGWEREDVAAAQNALVIQELTEDTTAPIGPYAAFRWAMDIIGLQYATLLDAGCGAGHYGVLCERFYPRTSYYGTDISDAMIVYARRLAPLGRFSVCEFRDNRFEDYDIILASQVIEQTDNPLGSLDILLSRAKRYIILNRIRLTTEESHRIEEGTYCGNIGHNWLWNLVALTHFIEHRAEIVARNDWATEQCTMVVKRRDDESAEL